MKNHQKGSVGIILIVIIVLLLVVVGYIYFKQSPSSPTNSQISNGSETANEQNIAPSIQIAGWKTYTDSQFNFDFQYPDDWSVTSSVLPNSTDVQEILTVKKSNYSIQMYVSKRANPTKESSSLRVANVATINGQQLVRDMQPRLEAQEGDSYYFVILSQNSVGAYSRNIQNGAYYYSIYYYLPSVNFDQSIISEADSIVATLKFK